MRIKRCPIIFNNVISAKAECKKGEWYETARGLRNAVIKNGLYGTGPIIFQAGEHNKLEDTWNYTFYLPVNAPIKMAKNDKYSFYELWKFDDGITLRHADMDESIEDSYDILRECARANNLVLQEPFYNIYLDVYGDGIIDIYAPVVREG